MVFGKLLLALAKLSKVRTIKQYNRWKRLSHGKGLDNGILEMSVGERSIFTISRYFTQVMLIVY